MSRNRVLVVGGTGYLGQHLLQGLSEIKETTPSYDLAFTYHSTPPPQALVDAIPHSFPFHVDLRTGHGFDAISQTFGQVKDMHIFCWDIISLSSKFVGNVGIGLVSVWNVLFFTFLTIGWYKCI
ncbi:unnamed protein product [Ilex paraguariensis]|uniref:3-beta hydroxysteroid dehydrogenase/isomerase domain-containing protein n=1 Tax=Ilex paraguariensis TaxID=185542 RepID=A0ABC8UG92_9AQUA